MSSIKRLSERLFAKPVPKSVGSPSGTHPCLDPRLAPVIYKKLTIKLSCLAPGSAEWVTVSMADMEMFDARLEDMVQDQGLYSFANVLRRAQMLVAACDDKCSYPQVERSWCTPASREYYSAVADRLAPAPFQKRIALLVPFSVDMNNHALTSKDWIKFLDAVKGGNDHRTVTLTVKKIPNLHADIELKNHPEIFICPGGFAENPSAAHGNEDGRLARPFIVSCP